MKKISAITILSTILGTPTLGFVANFVWNRIDNNSQAIQKVREMRAEDKSTIKAIHEDVKIIKTLLLQRR